MINSFGSIGTALTSPVSSSSPRAHANHPLSLQDGGGEKRQRRRAAQTTTNRYRRALVPLSADPITFGHIDLIRAARERSDEVVVLIADNDVKRGSYLFPLPERAAMAERAIAHAAIDRVRVVYSNGLLIDAYLREGCDVVFRGVRDAADRAGDELQMRLHDQILSGISDRVVFVPAKPEHAHVSSTMVKAFVSHDVDVARFVPAFVKQVLEERMRHQWRIAVTGCVASGKSWVCNDLARHIASQWQIPTTHLDIDQLQRDLSEEDSPGAQLVRDGLAKRLGPHVLTNRRRSVNRRVLAEKLLFAEHVEDELRAELHNLIRPHVERKMRETLRSSQGLVIIEWAQLAEMDLGHWANYHALVIDTPDRDQFFAKRGIDTGQAGALARLQWDADHKVAALEERAREAGNGYVLRYENRSGLSPVDLHKLCERVLALFPNLCSAFGGAP